MTARALTTERNVVVQADPVLADNDPLGKLGKKDDGNNAERCNDSRRHLVDREEEVQSKDVHEKQESETENADWNCENN